MRREDKNRIQFVKILNEEKAKKLANLGHSYCLDTINHTTVFSFEYTKEVKDYINKELSRGEYFIDTLLHF